MIYIDTPEFLDLAVKIPIVDVRSPAEFNHGHITNAINIPLFSDDERAVIGTLYNMSGRKDAIARGIDIATPKRGSMVEKAAGIAVNNQLLVHCWRGGMRSEQMALLFETSGIKCRILKGGYKAYRNQLLRDFEQPENLRVIYGPTGCGKTEILNYLAESGEQVIDLEDHAHHRGSVFGNLGLLPQPTTMQFQNNIHYRLQRMDKNRRIWVEGESLSIGKVYLPVSLWNRMNHSPVYQIEMPRNLRIQRIIREYGRFSSDLLNESVKKLMRRFGGDRTKNVMQLVSENQLEEAVNLLLDYYDENYTYSFKKYIKGEITIFTTNTPDARANAESLLTSVSQKNF